MTPFPGRDGNAAGAGLASDEGAGRIRCFAAAFLTPESARRLEAAMLKTLDPRVSSRRAARRVPAANYHVTLKFLGEIEPAALAPALAAVDVLNGHGVAGEITGLAGFPHARGARLVAAELAVHEQLEGWWAALEASLGAEGRRFRPHVTVLRLRRPRTVRRSPLPEPLPVALTAPQLYRSDQTENGVRYRPVASPP